MELKIIKLFTILSLVFSTDAYSCGPVETKKKAEKFMEDELGKENIVSLKTYTSALSHEIVQDILAVRAIHKNGQEYIMYLSFDMDRDDLSCILLHKSKISLITNEQDTFSCSTSSMKRSLKYILLAHRSISEIRDFKYLPRQRSLMDEKIFFVAGETIDDNNDLRLVYLVFRDSGGTCKLIDYTNPAFIMEP